MSYLVARRTNEIGMRMALGAQRHGVLSLMLRNCALLLVPGLVLGAVLSAAVAQATRAILFGLKPTDPRGLGAPIVGLCFLALLTCLLPTRRPTPLLPLVALP